MNPAAEVTPHVVLLGDSVFDNGVYVGARESLLESVRRTLPANVAVTLLAQDGAVTTGVASQLAHLGPEHTHLFISTGGNDALSSQSLLAGNHLTPELEDQLQIPAQAIPVGEVEGSDLFGVRDLYAQVRGELPLLDKVTLVRAVFRKSYRTMLKAALTTGLPVTVCTIYDQVPGLHENLRTALAVFNEVILFEAATAGVPVIDLRGLCDEPDDFSSVSEIEPSGRASAKMAKAIKFVLNRHDFCQRLCTVYGKQVLR